MNFLVTGLAKKRKQSVDFTGCWQRCTHEKIKSDLTPLIGVARPATFELPTADSRYAYRNRIQSKLTKGKPQTIPLATGRDQ